MSANRPAAEGGPVDRAVDAIGRAAAWLNLGMAGTTCSVVALRYVFDAGAIWLQESVAYMHGAALLLGLSFALRHDAHVRVDVFYARFSPRARARVDLLGATVLLMPLAATIVAASYRYVLDSWRVLEGSPEVGGLPAVFLLKTLLPISAALLFLQAAATALRNWRQLRYGRQRSKEPLRLGERRRRDERRRPEDG